MPHSPTVERLGGYPRLWFGDGGHLDSERFVPDDQVQAYMAGWKQYGVRVEWLLSKQGRLDRVLPQTLERLRHNANVRSWREHKIR